MGDLSLVVHCPLLAGPSAVFLLLERATKRGTSLGKRDDPTGGKKLRHSGKASLKKWQLHLFLKEEQT